LAAKEMLTFYAGQLSAVEINNTFYRLPSRTTLASWATQVPEDFRFTLKASRRITHFKRLENAEDETDYLISSAATLEQRLGVILFQLPPDLKKDTQRLARFLDIIPRHVRTAFEFRHASWLDEEVLGLLRSNDCALCCSDTQDDPITELPSTSTWGYLRLRRASYDAADLKVWHAQIAQQPWRDVFVFFKHEDEGAGPQLARQFIELSRGKV
jgi:uncharacterized protein YecE (DUF72 family)